MPPPSYSASIEAHRRLRTATIDSWAAEFNSEYEPLKPDELPTYANPDFRVTQCVIAPNVLTGATVRRPTTIENPTLDEVEQLLRTNPSSGGSIVTVLGDNASFTFARLGTGYMVHQAFQDADCVYVLLGSAEGQTTPTLADTLAALRTYFETGAINRALYWATDYF